MLNNNCIARVYVIADVNYPAVTHSLDYSSGSIKQLTGILVKTVPILTSMVNIIPRLSKASYP